MEPRHLVASQTASPVGTSDSRSPSLVTVFHGPPGAPALEGTLIELAPKDVVFHTSRLFPPGTMLQIHMISEPFDLEILTLCLVHWSVEVLGRHQCGAFLRSELPQEWLDIYWGDVRKELRFEGQWLMRAWTDSQGSKEDVVVGNYSRNGVQFLASHAFEAGQKVYIGNADAYVVGHVRWCRSDDRECYRVGCQLEQDTGVRLASLLRFSALDL